MSWSRLLVVALAVGGGWYVVTEQDRRSWGGSGVQQGGRESFVDLGIRPDGHEPDRVYVMIPPNCPSEAAQRGRSLLSGLDRWDIPHRQISQFRLDTTGSERQQRRPGALDQVLDGGPPIVFINDHARSDPSLSAVAAAYPLLTSD
jgi:hypothetical protein